MTYILIHNPNCSTSRNGLALLQENGVEPHIRKYTNKSEQLSEEELRDIAGQLGGVSPREFLRAKDAAKFDLADDASDDQVFAAMAAEPRLIQRPIGIHQGKAVLGRPFERLLKII